ncbi:hypothetical protein [Streptomyces sp. NRRL S-350]|uniref:hypothetical protein n=1 Tax=Streptomyces sp. NRRL S-350 TaxID=1463902 RepID=UPI0004BE4FB7|nr:hypothetical protein [Streptomyces sp. NRRL S-350]
MSKPKFRLTPKLAAQLAAECAEDAAKYEAHAAKLAGLLEGETDPDVISRHTWWLEDARRQAAQGRRAATVLGNYAANPTNLRYCQDALAQTAHLR